MASIRRPDRSYSRVVQTLPTAKGPRLLLQQSIKNYVYRERQHVYDARVALGWGLSKDEAGLYAGLRPLVFESVHTLIPKKHFELLFQHEIRGRQIELEVPGDVHTIMNGSLQDFTTEFFKLMKPRDKNGVAGELRKQRGSIDPNLRLLGMVALGKFLKYGPQHLHHSEIAVAKDLVHELRDKGAVDHFRTVHPDTLIKALDGDKNALQGLKASIQKAAEQTRLGQELKQKEKVERRKKIGAIIAAGLIGFGAGQAVDVKQAALDAFSKGKPAITQTTQTIQSTQTTMPRVTTTTLSVEARLKQKHLGFFESGWKRFLTQKDYRGIPYHQSPNRWDALRSKAGLGWGKIDETNSTGFSRKFIYINQDLIAQARKNPKQFFENFDKTYINKTKEYGGTSSRPGLVTIYHARTFEELQLQRALLEEAVTRYTDGEVKGIVSSFGPRVRRDYASSIKLDSIKANLSETNAKIDSNGKVTKIK